MRSWIQQGNRYLSNPYQIVSNVRGYDVWIRTKDRYGVLGREIQTLEKAKQFCEVDYARKNAADSGAGPAAAVDGSGD
jgi:hypothetical protein